MARNTPIGLCTAAGVGAGALLGGAAAIAAVCIGVRALLARPLPAGAVVVITGG